MAASQLAHTHYHGNHDCDFAVDGFYNGAQRSLYDHFRSQVYESTTASSARQFCDFNLENGYLSYYSDEFPPLVNETPFVFVLY